jgi:hypothetical protein
MDVIDRDALMEWYLKYGERGIEFRRLADVDARFVVLYYDDWLEDVTQRDYSKYVLKVTTKGLEFIKNGT